MLPSDEIIKNTKQEADWISAEIATALEIILPILLARRVIRLDSQVEGVGSITAYWVNDILRIDIKPVQE